MLLNNDKNEYSIKQQRITKSYSNQVNDISCNKKISNVNVKKVSSLVENIKTSTMVGMNKLYTSVIVKEHLLMSLLNIYDENYKINFNNKKYNIDIYLFGSKTYLIDCFHMNTITMQNYKRLIYEIYHFIENTKIKFKLYIKNNNTNENNTNENNNDNINNYKNITTIIFDNIDKLDVNKVEILYSIFSNETITKKYSITFLEIHYFLSQNIDNYYFDNSKNIYIGFGKQLEINMANNKNNEHIHDYTIKTSVKDILDTNLKKENKNPEIKREIMYEFIQETIKKRSYSFELINEIYKEVLNRLLISYNKNKMESALMCIKKLNACYYDFNQQINSNSLRHLVYENTIVKMTELYNSVLK